MNKMDALNQKVVCRVFRQIRNVDIGITNEHQLNLWLHNLQEEYFEEMINIMEEKIDG